MRRDIDPTASEYISSGYLATSRPGGLLHDPITATIGATLVGGAISASGAKSAAKTQAGAAQAGIDAQTAQFNKVRELLNPFVQAATGTPAVQGGQFDGAAYLAQNPDVAANATYGNNPYQHYLDYGQAEGRAAPMTVATPAKPGALGSYLDLIGLNGNQPQQDAITGIAQGAEYNSLATQGRDAILQAASATGGLRGGNTETGLANFRANLLSSLIDKQLGRYGGLVTLGQNSAAGVGNAAMTTGTNTANLLGQQGAAVAGGQLAGTNAITSAIGTLGGLAAGTTAGTVPSPTLASNAVSVPSLTGGFGSGTVTGFAPQPRLF